MITLERLAESALIVLGLVGAILAIGVGVLLALTLWRDRHALVDTPRDP